MVSLVTHVVDVSATMPKFTYAAPDEIEMRANDGLPPALDVGIGNTRVADVLNWFVEAELTICAAG